jgi:hypothetical protein
MNTRNLLIVSSLALLAFASALAAEGAANAGSDPTTAAVAALEATLGKGAGLEVDEVRVTDTGVACIDYRASDGTGRKSPDHAVVQGKEVLKGSSGDERFETAWSEHCLGPRGGMTRDP